MQDLIFWVNVAELMAGAAATIVTIGLIIITFE